MEMTIRDATVNDAKAIIEYIEKISAESDFLTFGQGEFNQTLEQEARFIENISNQKNAIFVIAIVQEQIVGLLNYSGGSRPRLAHTGEFGISVLKAFWGLGIGTALVSYLIDWARESTVIRKINLRVRSDNRAAIHLYSKLGFIEEGTISREFFLNGLFYDSICMGLEIDPLERKAVNDAL